MYYLEKLAVAGLFCSILVLVRAHQVLHATFLKAKH